MAPVSPQEPKVADEAAVALQEARAELAAKNDAIATKDIELQRKETLRAGQHRRQRRRLAVKTRSLEGAVRARFRGAQLASALQALELVAQAIEADALVDDDEVLSSGGSARPPMSDVDEE